jgi:putative oxidoreductase
MEISLALLIVRVVIGLLMIGHGSQKMFGWFGGNGFAKTIGFLKSVGFKPALFWALLGALGELGGGVLFLLGLLTPLGALAIFASMLMAVLKFHWKAGIWAQKGGYEYPFVVAIVALATGLVGAGSYSIDAVIGFSLPTTIYLVLAVVAIVVDLIGIATSRPSGAQTQQEQAA